MFHRKRQDPTNPNSSLVARGTAIHGSVVFSGTLYLEGALEGELSSVDTGALLTVGEDGAVLGDIRVPTAIIHGHVCGDIHATGRLELSAKARVTGNIYYATLVMAAGAQVEGHMHHGSPPPVADALPQQPALPEPEPEPEPESEQEQEQAPEQEPAENADTRPASSAGPTEQRREHRRRRAGRSAD